MRNLDELHSPRFYDRAARFETFEPRLMLTSLPLLPAVDPMPDLGLQQYEGELTPQSTTGGVGVAAEMSAAQYARQAFGFTGAGQTVAVIDSGVAWDHESLGAGFGAGYRVVGGWDFTENDADPYDDAPGGYHGTHVAGIVGSSHDEYTGVAPGVDLVALRVFNDQGYGEFEWVESALAWVHEHRFDFENPITTVNLSLGANGEAAPDWTILEDELAQLEAGGIFVSVAAGNSFTAADGDALSYPASSQYVVPVASVGANGQISDFSQRHERVLAAPGEQITSTVPDYLFDFNGQTDDYAALTGTSMAAPYVAGASTLVREAMQFVAYADVNQDVIYEHLRDTADLAYDSQTDQSYHVINLQRALDELMPEDDFGSHAGEAHLLELAGGETRLDGHLSRLDDADYFRFTATANGAVTFTADTTDAAALALELAGGNVTSTDGVLRFEVQAGESYTVALTGGGLAHYELAVELEASTTPTAVDWGTIDFARLSGQAWAGEAGWFQVTAAREGLLTVEATGAGLELEVYNQAGQQLALGDPSAEGRRVDLAVAAGETLYVRAAGDANQANFRITNLVSVEGRAVSLDGLATRDRVSLSLGAAEAGGQHTLTVNGVAYQFEAAAVDSFHLQGGGEIDMLHVAATGADEVASISDATLQLTSSDYRVTATGFATIVVDGGGGHDRVELVDSAGDDSLVARPEWARLSGDGFYYEARNFESVRAHATGGRNTALLYDSIGSDRFVARPHSAFMQGAGYLNMAVGFDQVSGYSSAAGEADVAHFYDSAGKDRFVARSYMSTMYGAGYANYAFGFERIAATATTGDDAAWLFGGAGNDRLFAAPHEVTYRTDAYVATAANFDRVQAHGGGGYDTAQLTDSAAADRLYATPSYSLLYSTDYYHTAVGFERVEAVASGGDDAAYFFDSRGDDAYYGHSDHSTMIGAGYHNTARGFDRYTAYAHAGGADTAYLYDSAGNDHLALTSNTADLSSSGYSQAAQGFESFRITASQGYDTAELRDLATGDSVTGAGSRISLRSSALEHWAEGFDSVRALARAGHAPSAEVDAVDFLFERVGDWD